MAMNMSDRISRIKNKISQKLENGEFYEAHQLYKTLNFRLCSNECYNEAFDLLMEGALALFKVNQMSSAVDMSLSFVDLLIKTKATINTENLTRVEKLHSLISEDHIDRNKFVNMAIKWSEGVMLSPDVIKSSPFPSSSQAHPTNKLPFSSLPLGACVLHGVLGINYWREKDYPQARYHLMRSHEGEACAAMLIEYHLTLGFPYEVDLFLAQAVLQYLCLQNKKTAEVCFSKYTVKHPQIEKGPPFIRPLLNFLNMLLLAVDGGNLRIFTVLCEQYKLSLKRDPCYYDYLDRIGQVFFNVPAPKKTNNLGILANLLPGLLGDDEDTEPCPVDLD